GDQPHVRDRRNRCAGSGAAIACQVLCRGRSRGVRLNSLTLRLLVLGCGKTGSLVADVARERGHQVQSIDADVNQNAAWLTPEHLRNIDVAIDFTAPDAVLANIEACVRAHKAMVVGTTGWYSELDRVRQAVE